MSLEELRKGKYVLDENQWLTVRVQTSGPPISHRPTVLPHFFLANFIPRVYCGRPWHGRSHPPPPEEFPPHGAFRTKACTLAIPLNRVRLHTWEFLISVEIQAGFTPSWKKPKTSACISCSCPISSFHLPLVVMPGVCAQDVPDFAESRHRTPGACPRGARRRLQHLLYVSHRLVSKTQRSPFALTHESCRISSHRGPATVSSVTSRKRPC